MKLWSGSATERVLRCAASAALPAVHTPSGDDAHAGTLVHEYVRNGLTRGRDVALRLLADVADPDLIARCAAIRLGAFAELGEIVDCEVAYAYAIDSGDARILGRNLGRAYPRLDDGWIPTTTDLEIIQPDGVRLIVDLKTGWQYVPGDTPQIRFHSLASMAARGEERNRVAIARIDDEGEIDISRPLDLDELDGGALAHELRIARDRVLRARAKVIAYQTPDVATGPWCRYCPAQTSCPGRVGLVRSVLAVDPADVRARMLALGPEEGGAMWEKYKAAEALLKQIGESLKELAGRTPLALPDGSTLEMRRVHFDAPVMVPDPSGATKTVDYMRPTVVKPKGARKPRAKRAA